MHYHGHRERLRAKLIKNPGELPDYEILELLLGQVLTRKDTKPLSKELLKKFNSIKGVLDARPSELLDVSGFGPGLLAYWLLLREVMARYVESPLRSRESLSTPSNVARMARTRLAGLDREEVWAAYVDTQNRLIKWEQCSRGTVDTSIVFPRDLLERAILLKASGFVLVHNHPGGKAEPSGADLQMTEHIKRASQTIGIRFMDHIIITESSCYSVMNDGIMDF